jgi:hypothetical protein
MESRREGHRDEATVEEMVPAVVFGRCIFWKR